MVTRLAPQPGPQTTAAKLGEALYALSGEFGDSRDTGCTITADGVRQLMTALDTCAAEATRLAQEIGELSEMMLDLTEPRPRPKKGPPQLQVIEGGGRV